MIQDIRLHHPTGDLPFRIGFVELRLSIRSHIDIEIAVVVVIPPRDPHAARADGDAGLFAYIAECAVAVAVEELVGFAAWRHIFSVRDIYIGTSVVVVIAERGAYGRVTYRCEGGALGDICKGSIVLVVI